MKKGKILLPRGDFARLHDKHAAVVVNDPDGKVVFWRALP
jgi:predicted transcriptional regulator